MTVPRQPPARPGVFHDDYWWGRVLGGHYRRGAATRNGALIMQRRGPRGGKRWAVASIDAWRVWAAKFNLRCYNRYIAKQAGIVRRSLDPPPPPGWPHRWR